MKCWAPRLLRQSNKQHALKLTQLKLEFGLFGARVGAANDNVAIQITGMPTNKGKPSSSSSSSSSASSKPKTTPLSFVPFHCTPKRRCTHTTSTRRLLTSKASSLVWDARDLCGFHLLLKDGSIDACHIAFHVFYGERCVGESKPNLTVVGKVEMTATMAELMKTQSNSHHHLQRRLPIKLRVNGLCIEATLLVSVRLLKLRDSNDDSASRGPIENRVRSEKKQGIMGKVKSLKGLEKKNNGKFDEGEQASPYESDGSPVFDSDDSSNESTISSGSSNNSGGINNEGSRLANNVSERFTSSVTETHLDTVQRSWSQSSRNTTFKGWNFKTPKNNQQTMNTYVAPSTKWDEVCPESYHKGNAGGRSSWEKKEISSRDGEAKLKTKVFLGSFDQRSEKASGESACTVLVALIAHWLHSNKVMPTRAQFDSLIRQGSSEWRRLCKCDYYSKMFPDKHFDLETIIEANVRPLGVLPQKSYTGFFSPDKFQCLKGTMSFDEIWEEIKSKVVDKEPRIYIVSWNDHFFVLKVDAEAYYIIDSLGERLFEGCKQAFILKFDESSVVYRNGKSEEIGEIICRGKECCKEFIKRFLAAIPLGQLMKEEKKWRVSNPYLHRQLQIDFHYTSSTSSSASSLCTLLS
ncbi:hypothetical protein VNO77_10793 [Canavalia gladiata]|uniref:C2 NT-type domain-containing protein n=1 Tax=Canavalia gladiata TaxID=3824 RepID=A0AAN9MHB6_CANGL